jgi:hypothetical protein
VCFSQYFGSCKRCTSSNTDLFPSKMYSCMIHCCMNSHCTRDITKTRRLVFVFEPTPIYPTRPIDLPHFLVCLCSINTWILCQILAPLKCFARYHGFTNGADARLRGKKHPKTGAMHFSTPIPLRFSIITCKSISHCHVQLWWKNGSALKE